MKPRTNSGKRQTPSPAAKQQRLCIARAIAIETGGDSAWDEPWFGVLIDLHTEIEELMHELKKTFSMWMR